MPQPPQQFQAPAPGGYYPATPLMMQPQAPPTGNNNNNNNNNNDNLKTFVICSTGSTPARPPVTDEDVRQVKELFPTVDNEVVKSVLEATGGNKDQAVTNLLSMTTE